MGKQRIAALKINTHGKGDNIHMSEYEPGHAGKNCINDIILRLSTQGYSEENIRIILNDYDIRPKETALIPLDDDVRHKAINMFIVTKKVEGCTDSTIRAYITALKIFFSEIDCSLTDITADTIRYFLAIKSSRDKVSKVTQDNYLRILKSFFGYCTAEDYIKKDPTKGVRSIRKEKRIKKPFSEIELEQIRNSAAAASLRDKAIIEVLYSTGCRVNELCGMNIADIEGDELTVFGKGEKERIVYLNAKAILAIKEYLKQRNDSNIALFVSAKSPYTRLSKGSVEQAVKKIGKAAGVNNCHPHRFRRTAATMALNRGMSLEQVQRMLGHEKIETTTIYARSEDYNVKENHRKYVI